MMSKDEKIDPLFTIASLRPDVNRTDMRKTIIELRKLCIWNNRFPNEPYNPLKAEALITEIVTKSERIINERARERERIAERERIEITKANVERFKTVFMCETCFDKIENKEVISPLRAFKWNEKIKRLVTSESNTVLAEISISPNQLLKNGVFKELGTFPDSRNNKAEFDEAIFSRYESDRKRERPLEILEYAKDEFGQQHEVIFYLYLKRRK